MKTSLILSSLVLVTLVLVSSAIAQQGDRDGHVMTDPPESLVIPPAPILSPEQALESFQIEDGFELQLVASEPLIIDPVCMAWDGDGRLWVCEMRGYMPDIDGTGEDEPSGNIVILDDTDGDGVMDTRTVFLDGIVLPRAIAHVKGGILYADQVKLYFQGINADGSAGARIVVDGNFTGGGNVEHKANGLLYGLDNWYYNAKSDDRYQLTRGRWLQRDTEFRGQWGIAQDDSGRLLTNSNSSFLNGELLPPNVTQRNPNAAFGNRPMYGTSRRVYPIRMTPGVNRAYQADVVDHETWTLINCTGVAGITLYRGDQYPEEFYGNLFVPEPCGYLLKRIVLTENDGRINATHAYDDREFLASTDERNRFVNAYTGPDGCVYVLDMYRGIIQHKTYVTSFLRRQILSRGLEVPGECGRIYRIVYTGNEISSEQPNMSEQSAVELVAHLTRRNAWWRETAQRLLVERRDDAALVPLRELAGNLSQPQGQIHALWTLDGMGALDIFTLEAAARSENPNVRVQVIRLAERFADTDRAARALAILQGYAEVASWEIDIQLCLSAGILAGIDTPEGYDLLVTLLERRGSDSLFRRAILSSLNGKEAVMLARVIDSGSPIVGELTAAMAKAVDSGDLSADSMNELIDSPMMLERPERRLAMLTNLAADTLSASRTSTALDLIERMANDEEGADTQAIMQGFGLALPIRLSPIQLEAEPELFVQWRENTPLAIASHLALLEEGQVFDFTPVIYSDDVAAMIANGNILFSSHCSECHGTQGRWIEGQQGPPLGQSQWVQGPTRQISALILHGVRGPIDVNGTLYDESMVQSEMPGFVKNDTVGDEELASILTYVRQAWGNVADPIFAADIAEMRDLTDGREGSYSVGELSAIKARAGEVVAEGARVDLNTIEKPNWLDNKPLGLAVMLGLVFVLMLGILGMTMFGGGK